MIEIDALKAVARKMVELWTGVSTLDKFGEPTSVTLPNGVKLSDPESLNACHALARAPAPVVDDWYASTLPDARRYKRIPLLLLSELVINARQFSASCEPEEQAAADGINSVQRVYTRHNGFDQKIVERKAWENLEYCHERVGRHATAPFELDRRGRRIVPEGAKRAELRREALENLKDVATAIGKLHDSNRQHRINFARLWYFLGCIDAGVQVHR